MYRRATHVPFYMTCLPCMCRRMKKHTHTHLPTILAFLMNSLTKSFMPAALQSDWKYTLTSGSSRTGSVHFTSGRDKNMIGDGSKWERKRLKYQESTQGMSTRVVFWRKMICFHKKFPVIPFRLLRSKPATVGSLSVDIAGHRVADWEPADRLSNSLSSSSDAPGSAA